MPKIGQRRNKLECTLVVRRYAAPVNAKYTIDRVAF
jgi:hypothetical protein